MVPPRLKSKRVKVAEQINERQAEKLVRDLVRFGDWTRNADFAPDKAVNELLAQNSLTPRSAREFARKFFEHIPMFENIAGPDWVVGGGVSIVRQRPDASFEDLTGPLEEGTEISLCSYWSKFIVATRHLLRAADSQAHADILAAISTGMTSIDAFILEIAERWNSTHSDRPVDTTDHSTASERLERWIPLITGKRYDKGGKSWQAYLRLRNVRNEWDQHDKLTYKAVSPSHLVQLANDFAPGIAEVLFDLHVLCGRRMPSTIIKYKYFPGFYCV
jgi:hypothetical protein